MFPGRILRLSVLAAFFAGATSTVWSAAQQPSARLPVVIASDKDVSPCDSTGEVVQLDPKGDNFLSVQSGPGGKPYTEVDRLHAKAMVHVCGERGAWWAIVYGPTIDTDCQIARPHLKRYNYTGPCHYGWVSKRYVEIVAG